MVAITVERVIAAPAEQVFDWLSDAGNYTRGRAGSGSASPGTAM
jgi:hypothetical protein